MVEAILTTGHLIKVNEFGIHSEEIPQFIFDRLRFCVVEGERHLVLPVGAIVQVDLDDDRLPIPGKFYGAWFHGIPASVEYPHEFRVF